MISDLQIGFLQNAGMSEPEEKHHRLRLSRERSYRTAKEAARAMGIPYGTYSGHEAGSRGFNNSEAARYARFFRTRLEWLLFGTGDSSELRLRPIAGQLSQGGFVNWGVSPEITNQNPMAMLDSSISSSAVTYQIETNELMPWFRNGTLIVCGYRITEDMDLDERQAIVSGPSTPARLAFVHATEHEELFDLECLNEPFIRNVKIDWAEEVLAIIPKRQWVKLPGIPK